MTTLIDIQSTYTIALLISLLLVSVPVPGKFFRGINTLIHEIGHALAALSTGGKVLRIELLSDTSGLAITRSNNKFVQFIISLAGYIFASVFACFSAWSITHSGFLLFYLLMAGLAVFAMILAVRNFYGILWLTLFTAGLVLLYFKADPEITQYFAVFLSSLLISESFLSCLRLFRLTVIKPGINSDASNLKKITGITTYFYITLFILQALLLTIISLGLIYPSIIPGDIVKISL